MGIPSFQVSRDEVAALVAAIDYSEALTIIASEDDVKKACAAGSTWGFRAVVAFPHYVPLMVSELKGSGVLAQVAVGFPCGGNSTSIKCREAAEGLESGARDLDMVMNIGAFKSGNFRKVHDDIAEVVKVAEPFKVPFKVIIEVGVLSETEIVTAAKLVADSGAGFVKTCTGFATGRATIRDILSIRRTIGPDFGIKASGGVASIEDGIALMRAGADVVAMRGHLLQQLESLGWPRRQASR